MSRNLAMFAALVLLAGAGEARAWGNTGHRIAGQQAMRALPTEIPAWLRTPDAAFEVGELSRELDRAKGSGKTHDSDRDPGHFVDIDEQGRVLGGPPFSPMPPTRAEYETQLRAAGLDSWKAGYLQYSIVETVQHLAKDLGYWRALDYAERRSAGGRRAWLRADRKRREALILVTVGALSHYVADGAQPLHASVHFNGWGDYPNPDGFTQDKIHSAVDGELVIGGVTPAMVARRMAPFRSCGCAVDVRAVDYLLASEKQVRPLYELRKAGALAAGDPRGTAFAADRLAVGASELRDLIVEAWRTSADVEVGWRPVKVSDVLAGRVDPYVALQGVD